VGKFRIMLLAGEPLLLRGGRNLAIGNERRRAVVIERGDPENAHGITPRASEQRVDERSDCGALGEEQKTPEQQHEQHDGCEPKLLARAHEADEFA
jgi:hypothetical protein